MDVPFWPTLTVERPATNGGLAIHSSQRWLGRPLYATLLPVAVGAWPTLNDPELTFAGVMPMFESRHSRGSTVSPWADVWP
jgi:hypothetical protein